MTVGAAHLACVATGEMLGSVGDPRAWLSPDEQVRLAVLAAPARRGQFIAARWLARHLLARAFGDEFDRWSITAPDSGPPFVHGPRAAYLSITHSGDRVACICSSAPVGIDLEVPRPGRDVEGLLALCCTPAEQELVRGDPQPHERFYEIWTIKESWIKRRGEAMSPSRLAQLEAMPDAAGDVKTWRGESWWLATCGAQALSWWPVETSAAPAGRWRVRDLRRV